MVLLSSHSLLLLLLLMLLSAGAGDRLIKYDQGNLDQEIKCDHAATSNATRLIAYG